MTFTSSPSKIIKNYRLVTDLNIDFHRQISRRIIQFKKILIRTIDEFDFFALFHKMTHTHTHNSIEQKKEARVWRDQCQV